VLLRRGSLFGIYDVMGIGDGELSRAMGDDGRLKRRGGIG
jgi:hypothetical protein